MRRSTIFFLNATEYGFPLPMSLSVHLAPQV
jgi:hypothetical protein